MSGGGIRAASVALGALRSLDREVDGGASIFRRARWLVGVSAGGWVAGGWRVARRPNGDLPPTPSAVRDGLFDAEHPWARSVRDRIRNLGDGFTVVGPSRAGCSGPCAVLGGLLSATYVLGWLAGRAVRTRALHAWFPLDGPASTERLHLR